MQNKENNSVLVIGSTLCAVRIAGDLSAMGTDVVLASSDSLSELQRAVDILGADRVLAEARVIDLGGAVGNFTAFLKVNDNPRSLEAAAIVIAERDVRQPNFAEYGLSPARGGFSLSSLRTALQDAGSNDISLKAGGHIVFLNGLTAESHPVVTGEIMRQSITLQNDFNAQTYILTRNLKVAADGLEALYRESKAAGTIYVKWAGTGPEIGRDEEGNVSIEFEDEVTGIPLRLAPDAVVVDEVIRPSDQAKQIGQCMGIEMDVNSFLQGDNVHRLTVNTNRRGIFVAGPAREIESQRDQLADAGNVAVAVSKILHFESERDDRAVIDRWQCVRCLTCLRICPYGAIQVEGRVNVMPQGCERCGICAAECPRHAITVPGLSVSELSQENSIDSGSNASMQEFPPSIIAFCCSRSAAAAARLARCMGCDLPERLTLVEVPCSGSLSYDHFFSAFQQGADGVLALTCHGDNCHSRHGNRYAQNRVAQLCELFPQMGLSSERLRVEALASNMGAEFIHIVTGFEEELKEIGPVRKGR